MSFFPLTLSCISGVNQYLHNEKLILSSKPSSHLDRKQTKIDVNCGGRGGNYQGTSEVLIRLGCEKTSGGGAQQTISVLFPRELQVQEITRSQVSSEGEFFFNQQRTISLSFLLISLILILPFLLWEVDKEATQEEIKNEDNSGSELCKSQYSFKDEYNPGYGQLSIGKISPHSCFRECTCPAKIIF